MLEKKHIHRVYRPLASNLLSLYPTIWAEIRDKPTITKANMSTAAAAASCQAQPQALPDGHSVSSDLKEGLGAWLDRGRWFVKNTAYAIWYSERCVSVAVYLSFFIGLSTTWPCNSVLWRFGSRSAAFKLLCFTCFPITVVPTALFYTHSRKPLIRNTQPDPAPVASLFHQESCDHDFSSSPRPPLFSPRLQLLHTHLCPLTSGGVAITFCPRAEAEILALTMHWIMMKDDNCTKRETGLAALWMTSKFRLISAEFHFGDHIRGRYGACYAVNNGAPGYYFVLWL